MFNNYADIFNKRGAAYHTAMRSYPNARDAEFKSIEKLLEPSPGQVIVDMPSGGGYLRRYLGANSVQLIAVETTEAFYSQCIEDSHTLKRLCDLDNTELTAESVDSVASMAGLHHVEDRSAVFQEIYRILKPGGRLCVADVNKGSVIDDFLNTFVDQNNTMGHKGFFIDADFRSRLNEAQFDIEFDETIRYFWKFRDVDQMIDYCTLMFGLDKANFPKVLNGIETYQGYDDSGTACKMNWELQFICCTKK